MLKNIIIITSLFLSTNLLSQSTQNELDIPPPPKNKSNQPESKIWYNDEFKIKMKIPYEWYIAKPYDGEIAMFLTPNREAVIIRGSKTKAKIPVNNLKIYLEPSYMMAYTNKEQLSSKQSKVGKIEYLETTISGVHESKVVLFKALVFHKNKITYNIFCAFPIENRSIFLQTLNKVLGSIIFTVD